MNEFLATSEDSSLIVDSNFSIFSTLLVRFDIFIKCIESPQATLAILHESFQSLSTDFQKQNEKAHVLLGFVIRRLSDNGTLALAKLAYTLSPKGLSDFRELYGDLTTDFIAMEHLDGNAKEKAYLKCAEIRSLTKTLDFILIKLGLPNEVVQEVINIFPAFLGEKCRSKEPATEKYQREPTFQFWMEHLIKAQNNHNEAAEIFAEIGVILSVTPISESSCERVFSHLKQIHNAFRARMDFKLLRAMLRIKMWCLQRPNLFPNEYE